MRNKSFSMTVDVVKEGFPQTSVEGFIYFYCKANKVKRTDLCCRQEFEHDD